MHNSMTPETAVQPRTRTFRWHQYMCKSPRLAWTQMELGKAEVWLLVASVAAAQKPREMGRFRALSHTRSRLNSGFPQLPALPWFQSPSSAGTLQPRAQPQPFSRGISMAPVPQGFLFLASFLSGGNLRCGDALLKIFRTGRSKLCFCTSIKASTKILHGHVGKSWKCLRVRNGSVSELEMEVSQS